MSISIPKSIQVINDLPLSKHSSLRIGGTADRAIFPRSAEEMVAVIDLLADSGERFDIIGNASNILFDDAGYRGTLIFTRNMSRVSIEHTDQGAMLCADCGKRLTELASEALREHKLSGLEFAYGIPGTVGGAVYMNAGAYGGEMKDIVRSSICYDKIDHRIVALNTAEHQFAYRSSILQKNKNLILLTTCMGLLNDNGEALSRALANMQSRKEKQPLELPNAGSAFKRPDGYIAAKLIDDCGLKGLSVGGAQVSTKHAGFFVNTGNATSKDILGLAKMVRDSVYSRFGVMLESEIIYIPEK